MLLQQTLIVIQVSIKWINLIIKIIKINFVFVLEKMSRGLQHLEDEFHQAVGQGSSGIDNWIDYFYRLPKLDKPDQSPNNWPGFIDQMFKTLNDTTLDSLKSYLEGEGADKSEIDKKAESYKMEILNFINTTLYPYDKCLIEERADNYTKIVDELNVDEELKREMQDGLYQVKKIARKMNTGESKEQLLDDAKHIKSALEKVNQAKLKAQKKLPQGNDGEEEYLKTQKIFTQNLNQYANRFCSTTFAIRKWNETDQAMTQDEYNEFHKLM